MVAPTLVDRGWLWSVRVAALVSLLLIHAPALVLQPVHWPMAWPFWAPYLILLWLLRASTLSQGLAWAVGAGSAAFLVAIVRLLWEIGWGTPATGWAAAGYLGPFALSQLALAAGALMVFGRIKPEPLKRRSLRWSLALGAVCFLVPSAYSVWVERNSRASPMKQAEREDRAQREASNEAQVLSLVKGMRLCAESYAAGNPERGFPGSQSLLGPEWANCVEAPLVAGQYAGYRFNYAPGEPDSSGRIGSYTIAARPIQYGHPTRASFFTDESGVIRLTREDRNATAADPAR